MLNRLTYILLSIIIAVMSFSINILAQNDTTKIIIDGAGQGRRFDGIGAVSGGGGTSRLLFDYPDKQRNEILDYLFKPNYGASLQIFKVEIGGDENSTNGAEASHMRSAVDQNYNRGYEWWLMEQAKLRDSNIVLSALEWGAPGWFKGGFWSQDNINYILNWIKHAQSDHNLHIDCIGGWNESPPYDRSWLINLKKALLNDSLTTQLIAEDSYGSDWGVVSDIQSDTAFKSAVNIIGVHYPCGGDGSAAISCDKDSTAQALNLPIWASEHGSQNFDGGALALARAINRDYIDSKITAMINWSLVCSWYNTLPDWGMGLLQADQPWSGYYHLGRSIWAVAHTTQFTKPGWQYIDSACGYLGNSRTNGSYVTLKSNNASDFSVIVETIDALNSQAAVFKIAGGLSANSVHVWATNIQSLNSSDYFIHLEDITPLNGIFSVTLLPGYIYTLTTTTGQNKGNTASPLSTTQSLPFSDDFESYNTGSLAKFFAAVQGAFEIDSCKGGRSGLCLRQEINTAPIPWGIGSKTAPLVVVGDPKWTNYKVSVDVLLEQVGYAELIGHLNGQSQWNSGASQGYHLQISSSGSYAFFKADINGNETIFARGQKSIGLNKWHNLSIIFKDDSVKAFIDSSLVASISDASYGYGHIGLLVSKWQNAEFDNFKVTSTGENNISSVDDAIQGTGLNQFNYVGNGWTHCASCGSDLFNGSNSWDNTVNDYMTMSFDGVQVKFYGVKDPAHGIGAVSLDNGVETNIDFYSSSRAGNQLLWTSPILNEGEHNFKLRVTGTRNPGSSNTYVVVDRADITDTSGITGVQSSKSLSKNYCLYQNYPNPFNPSTKIGYTIPGACHVTIKIYDVLGREISTLLNNQQTAGYHEIKFDGSKFSSGIYFFRLQAGDFVSSKKMALMK
ncbi:MAG: T9SS type A sorting domain-containing protein [Ignavibacteriaceae bacterium]|nr:T9SS type A sorting domain-containing protein [Ignavibacteriaceae bacterium]